MLNMLMRRNLPPLDVDFEINRASPQAVGLVDSWSSVYSRGLNVLYGLTGVGRNSSFTGGPTWISSEYGNVFRLDGSTQYVEIANTAALTFSQLSIGGWFRVTNTSWSGHWKGLVARNANLSNGFALGLLDASTFVCRLDTSYPNDLSSATFPGADIWFHAMLTWNGLNTISFYLNGVLQTTQSTNGATSLGASTALMRLGEWDYDSGSRRLAADYVDVRLYNVEKLPVEIWQMYDAVTRWDLYKPLLRRSYFVVGNVTEFLNAAGSIVPNGIITRQPQVIYASSNIPTGFLNFIPSIPFASTLSKSGELLKQANTVYSGQPGLSGQPNYEVQTRLSGLITPSGSSILNYTIALIIAGVLSLTGFLQYQVNKLISGSTIPTSNLTKTISATFSGNLTPSSILSNIKTIVLSLSSNIPFSGTLVSQVNKLVSGSMNFTSNIIKQVNTFYSGQETPLGDPNYSVNTSFAGTLVFSGILTNLKTILLSITGLISPLSNLIKQINTSYNGQTGLSGDPNYEVQTSLSGNITPSSTLSIIKTVLLSIAGTLGLSGVINWVIGKLVTGTQSLSGIITKAIQTSYEGQLNQDGSINSEAQTRLSGLITPSSILDVIKTQLISMGGSLTPLSNLIRQINTSYSSQLGLSGQPNYEVQTSFNGSVIISGILSAIKTSVLSISASIPFTGTLIFQISKIYQSSVNLSGVIIKEINTSYTGVMSSSGQAIKQVQTLLSGSINLSGILSLISIPATPITEAAVYFKGMFKSMFRRMR